MFTASPAQSEPVYPQAYVVDVQTTVCSCCHSTFEAPTTWARTQAYGRYGMGVLTQLKSILLGAKLYNLPIQVARSKTRVVPFCHLCNSPSLSHYDAPPVPLRVVADQAWTGAHAPKASEGGTPAPGLARQPRRPATIDDLLI